MFTPFGRLETHAAIEGTGLGLLSARKIVEAHGGGAFIEGYSDGTSSSPTFTTAQDQYPSLLSDGFRTAFVLSCPLPPEDAPSNSDTRAIKSTLKS